MCSGPAIFFVVVLLLLAASGILLYLALARSRTDALLEAIRAAGEPVTMADVEAARPDVPDDQNMALVILEVGANIQTYGEESEPIPIFGLPVPGELGEKLSEKQLAACRKFLDANRENIKRLSKSVALAGSRFPIVLSSPAPVLDSLSPYRSASKVFALEALVAANDGRPEDAYQTIVISLQLDRAMENEPTILSALVRTACQALSLRAIEDTLALGTLSQADLRDLQLRLAELEQRSSLRWALLTERALSTSLFITFQQMPGGSGVRGMFFRMDRADHLRVMGELCDAAKLPPAEFLKRTMQIERQAQDLPIWDTNTKILMPSLVGCVETWGRTIGTSRATRTGLAAERFRMKHDRWPKGLDELVGEFLEAVPTDPFDDQPIRYRIDEAGVCVYSIGDDLVDNGGTLGRYRSNAKVRDWGIYLLNPDRRNRPARATTAPSSP